MSMKKKLFLSTVAASVALGTMSVVPLSSKGLAEKFGVVSYADAATTSTNFNTAYAVVKAVHDELAKDADGFAKVKASDEMASSFMLGLLNSTDPGAQTKINQIIQPVWDKIQAKLTNSTGTVSYQYLTPNIVFAAIAQLTIPYSQDGSSYFDALTNKNGSVWNVLNDLAKLDNMSGAGALSFADVSAFYNAALSEMEKTTNLAQVLGAAVTSNGLDIEAAKSKVSDIITQNVIQMKADNLSKLLSDYGITMGDINAVKKNIVDADPTIDPNGEAKKALTGAFVRYILNKDGASLDQGTSNNGRTATVNLIFKGATIPASLLTWQLKDHTDSVSVSGNTFSLNDGFTSASTVTIAAYGQGILVYTGTINLAQTSKSSNNTGGGGGGGSTDDSNQQTVDITKKDLDSLKDQIKNATGDDKQKLLDQAKAKVADAIQQITKVDLSKLVEVKDGKATPKLDVAALISQIKDLKAQIDSLKSQLKDLGGDTNGLKAEFTLDLGAVTADSIEVPLSKDLLAAAKDNGLDAVAVKVNGVTLAVDPSTFNADTTLNIAKKDASVATSVTSLQVASDVYEFDFTSNGNKVTNFSKPVQVRIPVKNADKVDTELLTLAKIIDGKLLFFGGKYDSKTGLLDAQRNGFSTYTVVENKVTFNDTASVKDWAGRQIEVAAAKGILEGREEGSFVPNGKVTRAEFAKMLVTAFSLEDVSATESFKDVQDSDWFKPYVASAVKAGIVNGRTDTTFDPNGEITRAEMATMAARALKLTGQYSDVTDVDGALKAFADAGDINASLKSGVAFAAKQGIVVGEDNNKFDPAASSTRAQAAVVIYRLLNK